MDWLNYHHLLYFWTAAREGGVLRAAERLRLRPPTVSGQIRMLEESLGEKLFARSGRRLVLTETGRLVYGYADEIFALGREMQEAVRTRTAGASRALRLVVGVADIVPKLVAHRLLAPVLSGPEPVRIVVREDRHPRLLALLATHELDVVISEIPLSPAEGVRAYNHLLGECGVAFFAAPGTAPRLRKGFPRSLDAAPFLYPLEGTALRRTLDDWFEGLGIRPEAAGEFEDSALLKVFGQRGAGAFAAPAVIAPEVERQYGVRRIGETGDIRERFYALSPERRLRHPAVAELTRAAREDLFG